MNRRTRTDDLSIGLVVQAAREILDLKDVSIEQIGLLGNQKIGYMQGVARLGNRLITILIRKNSYDL
ncbi:chemotaxis protein CheW [Peribacillus sp. NPDC060186]